MYLFMLTSMYMYFKMLESIEYRNRIDFYSITALQPAVPVCPPLPFTEVLTVAVTADQPHV